MKLKALGAALGEPEGGARYCHTGPRIAHLIRLTNAGDRKARQELIRIEQHALKLALSYIEEGTVPKGYSGTIYLKGRHWRTDRVKRPFYLRIRDYYRALDAVCRSPWPMTLPQLRADRGCPQGLLDAER